MHSQKLGQRKKVRITLSGIQKGLNLARERFKSRNFLESFDIYEQIYAAYPDYAVKILAEVYILYQQFPYKDRYRLYQERQINFDIKPSDQVLDIGSGHIPFPLATHLADISVKDHDYGRGSVPFKHIEGKPVFECNIEKMPFEDKQFDFIYCSHVLEHTRNPERACEEIMRVAKRGYIETPTKGKDIFLNSIKISNHNFWTEVVNDKLIFIEYTPEEIEGMQCSILMSMHTSPQTEREKAFSALIYLKPQLFNTMHFWDERLDFEVRRLLPSKKVFASTGPETLAHHKEYSLSSNTPNTSQKFLQVHTFYPQYLKGFYLKNSSLASASYQDQIDALNVDGFSSIHIFAPYMNSTGYDSQLIVANNQYAQQQWSLENNIKPIHAEGGMPEIVRHQVNHIKPDVLYLSDPITFDSKFIRSLSWKPKLVLGWRAANIPAGTDWTEFDVIMSSLNGIRSMALKLGARSVEHFFPGYPEWINKFVQDTEPEYDVVFSGTWSLGQHPRRNKYISLIADEASRGDRGFTCAFYINTNGHNEILPPNVAKYNLGPRFGFEMHRALCSGRIVIDSRGILELKHPSNGTTIDLAEKQTANMRIFEATGSGCFLLTEYHENLPEYFEPGVEIETFRNENELIGKIQYYLEHADQRKAIASRGQKRCLHEYNMEKRAAGLDAIIKKYLSLKNNINTSCASLKDGAEDLIKDSKYREALELITQAKALKQPSRGLDMLRALCFLKMNDYFSAREALKEELRLFPENDEARNEMIKVDNLLEQKSRINSNDQEFCELIVKIKPFTMVAETRLYSLFSLAKAICQKSIPGNFVECGVAAGGTSALLAYVIQKYSKQPRMLFAFDSFSGMPCPTKADSHKGIPANETGWGEGTCAASEASVNQISRELGVHEFITTIKGLFEDTLPKIRDDIGNIAVLHVDGDWYESTKTILENLFDRVDHNGVIQVDDYGHWDGCRKAVTEFENTRNMIIPKNTIDYSGIWFAKSDISTKLPVNSDSIKNETKQMISNNPAHKYSADFKDRQLSAETKLKVVHLCMQDFGGAGIAAYRLHQGLQQNGVFSTMIVLNKRSGDPSVKVLPADYNTSQAKCVDVDKYNSPVSARAWKRWKTLISRYPNRPAGFEIFTDPFSEIKIEQIQEIQRADIINLHWVAGLIDNQQTRLIMIDKPVVWTLHDMNPFTGGCHYSGDCEKFKTQCGACPQLGSKVDNDLSQHFWQLKRNAYQNQNLKIATPSKWLGDCAKESTLLSPYPAHIVPYGFPLDTLKPYQMTKIRREKNIPVDANVIIFGADSIGNARKGFKYLLEALDSPAIDKQRDTILLTFGQVPEKLPISSSCSVYHFGHITDQDQLAQAYSAADVFVIPSLEDNLPNTAIEAMACGVPVVGFNVGGIPEIIDHKKTGYLVEPRDIAGLIKGINWVLAAKNNGFDLSMECREKAENRYSLDAQASAYQELYTQLLQDSAVDSRKGNKNKNWEQKGNENAEQKLGAAKNYYTLVLESETCNENVRQNLAAINKISLIANKKVNEYCPNNGRNLKMLNLGCGSHYHKEWINIDFQSKGPEVMNHNLCLGIPVPDESCDVVYHSHLLEHFPKRFASEFLQECYRALKPGGIIRVVQPDLERLVKLYLHTLEKSSQGDLESQNRYEWIMIELFDQMVRNRSGGEMLEYWKQNPMPAEEFVIERLGSEVLDAVQYIRSKPYTDNHFEDPYVKAARNKDESEIKKMAMFRVSGEVHQWMYDRYSLKKLLQETGFIEIKTLSADESNIPKFNRFLLDIEPTGKVRKPDSFFMEARKLG